MSFRTINELVSVLQNPFAKTEPEIRGGERDRTLLTREYDENGVFFIRKVNEGRLSVLSKNELRLMEDIAERAPDDPYVDEYLAKLLQTKKDYSHRGARSEIVMQWHGFDLGDFVRLLPVRYNDNWRNSTFLLQLLNHALRGLHALHRMGIVHADIKRDNITLEIDPKEDFLKKSNEIVLRPKNITLIDFGVSLGNTEDYSHLKRIGFANYSEGGVLYSWKAERLRAAHEELNQGKDELIRKIDYRVDLFALSHIFGDFAQRGLLEAEDHPHRQCLQQIIAELQEVEIRADAMAGNIEQREVLYGRWQGLIERAFKAERAATTEWVFKMPANKTLREEEDSKAPETHSSYMSSEQTRVLPQFLEQSSWVPPQLRSSPKRSRLFWIVPALLVSATVIAVAVKTLGGGGTDTPEEAAITTETPETREAAEQEQKQVVVERSAVPVVTVPPDEQRRDEALAAENARKAEAGKLAEAETARKQAEEARKLAEAEAARKQAEAKAAEAVKRLAEVEGAKEQAVAAAKEQAMVAAKTLPAEVSVPATAPGIERTETPAAQPSGASYRNSIGMKFVLVPPLAVSPPFRFDMGCDENHGDDDCDSEEGLYHETIPGRFYLGMYEVTQAQWKQVMENNNPSGFMGDDRPVENVSWEDAKKFIKRLNEMEGKNKYRLPTEKEWEYAARAGTKTKYSFGNNRAELAGYAWYGFDEGGASHDEGNAKKQTHPVGQKKANPWGLYDMHGNVWEWVEDGYAKNSSGEHGHYRVVRGGSWNDSAKDLRSAIRTYLTPGYRIDYVGFRLAISQGQ
jgi:formylglycine-generating enzyme required for sulfatase activity/serine/threonine protein kinase